jgi:hypothetical protein
VIGAACGATHKRAKVPVKSNPAAFLAATKWASIASAVYCANALAPHRVEKRKSAELTLIALFFIAASLISQPELTFWPSTDALHPAEHMTR